ncbi:Alpha/Beta hydrolase protein [Podospora aff. communis PSN243]|uniref:Alpha/Beta hydrolase protein n=1 Tax=Podospora aff. communis PSN243 TaxID=3040156 RepID=A0AAV9FZQ0_9PEZI|nr:Alpha/Beta hydrolase protein [Podospora aff. communis PSN243]
MRFFATASRFLLPLAVVFGVARSDCNQPWKSVTLPWGTYSPTECDSKLDIYVFRNIRFGKPPDGSANGTARFAASEGLDAVANPETVFIKATDGPTACLGVDQNQNVSCGKKTPNWGGPILAPGPSNGTMTMTEDCLFLDIFVPVSAVNSSANLPVVVWFYGGAYVFGSKDTGLASGSPLYDGRGLTEAAHNLSGGKLIYVAGNYRLAHLGWLAGSTVLGINDTKKATVNAGLSDQRLLLEFVRKHIELFGGNSSRVTAFGESAGAGSILHHLIATDSAGNLRDPLFNQAALQSAAYQWIWDQTPGSLSDTTFDKFLEYTAPCKNKTGIDGFNCLQQTATTDDLAAALVAYWKDNKCLAMPNLGPVVDGVTIRKLPAQILTDPVLQDFKFHSNVTALIASHVDDEAENFVPSYVDNPDGFDHMLDAFLQVGNSTTREAQKTCIATRYKNAGGGDPKKMAKAVIQDSMFVCNARFLYDAATKSGSATTTPIWLMWYAVFTSFRFGLLGPYNLAVHASDLMPTFWNDVFNQTSFKNYLCDHISSKIYVQQACKVALPLSVFPTLGEMRPSYQDYLASFILNNDPNSSGNPPWPHPINTNGVLSQVQKITENNPYAAPATDNFLDDATCSFWACMADAAVKNESPHCDCQPKAGPAPEMVVQNADAKVDL